MHVGFNSEEFKVVVRSSPALAPGLSSPALALRP